MYLCIVYVSEALRRPVLTRLRESTSRGVKLVHSFEDPVYNRTSFYLTSSSETALIDGALNLCSLAFEMIDFSQHLGSHPALGSVDHVCFSPLGLTAVDGNYGSACDAAGSLGVTFSRELHSRIGVPVYCYGYADAQKQRLRDIRKELGYFDLTSPEFVTENSSAVGGRAWGEILATSMRKSALIPTYGVCDDVLITKGITCVGALPYVLNFNMRFKEEDSRAMVQKVTKHVRQEGLVEALTLQHEGGSWEVACNLKNTGALSPDMVLVKAQELSASLGLTIVSHYTTGPTEEEILRMSNDATIDM